MTRQPAAMYKFTMSRLETAIVIPTHTYNEVENIGTLLPTVLAAAPVREILIERDKLPPNKIAVLTGGLPPAQPPPPWPADWPGRFDLLQADATRMMESAECQSTHR